MSNALLIDDLKELVNELMDDTTMKETARLNRASGKAKLYFEKFLVEKGKYEGSLKSARLILELIHKHQ